MTESQRPVALTATLVLAMASGPIVVFICSATGPLITDEFDLSKTEFGWLSSTAFLTAALASAVLGRAVDRVSPLTAVLVLHALSSAALLIIGIMPSLLALTIGLALSGLVQAMGNPVTNRIVAMRVSPGARGAVMGLKQSGVQMSQLVAGVAAPPLALLVGWSFSFIAALPIVALGAAFATLSLSRHASSSLSTAGDRRSGGVPPTVWLLAAYAVLTGAGLQASVAYLPIFAHDALGWRVGIAGLTVSLVGAAGVCARILWGHWTQSIAHIRIPLSTVAAGGAVSICLVMLTEWLDHTWLLWCAVVLFGLTGVAANVVVMVAVVGFAPVHELGRASGVLATGLFVGFACGPASFGVIADATDSYSVAWGTVVVLYVLATSLAFYAGRDPRPGRRVSPSPAQREDLP